jgi:lipopolysaccharide transport system ATP-binding protein
MNDLVIQAERLSKLYQIGASEARYGTLRESLTGMLTAPVRKLRGNGSHSTRDMLWALKDVSFEVKRGEVVGVIGRNGAGKSTLLKILSRITEPTEGRAVVHGRVGSLLEVGTGFHPELTGRENIYLSGAILGMHRHEIDQRFDQIVEFSEIARFLDMPVKRYSSGMYVRLAFAVAAYMEPDILLVDEVLAVGDIAFQQKCLRHMQGLTQSGMTILMVSHSMAAIQSSCQRAIMLQHGQIAADGNTLDVIEKFRKALKAAEEYPAAALHPAGEAGDAKVTITGFDMFSADGESRREFKFDEPIRIRIELMAHERVDQPMINFGIKRGDGVIISNFNNWYDNFRIDYLEGACVLEGWLPPLRLVPEFYEIHVLVWPWGGGHLAGDLSRAFPIAAVTYGDFHINGPGLNTHDGVYQTPALKWQFQRGAMTVPYDSMTPTSIYDAFSEDETEDLQHA